MGIFDWLDQQHKDLNEVLERLNGLHEGQHQLRRELLDQVVQMLTLHIQVENRLLYPELEQLRAGPREYIEESLAEHDIIQQLLGELTQWEKDFETWHDRLTRLQQACGQDIVAEDNYIFPQGRQILPQERQQRLATQAQDMQCQPGVQPAPAKDVSRRDQQNEAETVEGRVGGIGTQPTDPASTLAGHQGFSSGNHQDKH